MTLVIKSQGATSHQETGTPIGLLQWVRRHRWITSATGPNMQQHYDLRIHQFIITCDCNGLVSKVWRITGHQQQTMTTTIYFLRHTRSRPKKQ
jgi:hypothetical protein